MRRRRMSTTYPVLRRIAAVPLSEALIGKPGRPTRVPTVRRDDDEGDAPMTMAVSAPMTKAASRSVAAAASAVLGARGVVSVTGDANLGPCAHGVHGSAIGSGSV